MKRAVTVFIVLLLFLCVLPSAASANAPPPPNLFYLEIEKAPEEMAYADLLIQLSPQSPDYAEELPAISEYPEITAESEIVRYNEDGYVSFTLHCARGSAYLNGSSSEFRIGYHRDDTLDQLTPMVKVALLDQEGNILQISDALNTVPKLGQFARILTYNAQQNYAEFKFDHKIPFILRNWMTFFLPIALSVLSRMGLSVLLETLVARMFNIHPLGTIVLVNILTQTALITFMRFSSLTYYQSLMIGEAFVYLIETTAFLLLFKNYKKSKIILYTVSGNTLTLIMGLCLNCFRI